MDLDVPPAEKDAAKALGALWDRGRRRWYVPEDVDPTPFLRWIPAPRPSAPPTPPDLNLRSAETYLVTAPRACRRCGETSLAAGFLMAPGFQDFSVWEGDTDGQGRWGGAEGWRYAFHLEALPSSIAGQAIAHAPRYRRAYSRTTRGSYWANHCASCHGPHSDTDLFEEPGAPFQPTQASDLADQRAFRLHGAFEAGGSFGPAIDETLALQIPGVRAGTTTNLAPSPRTAPLSTSDDLWSRLRGWLKRRGG